MGAIGIVLALIAAVLAVIYTYSMLVEVYTDMETKASCINNKHKYNKATRHMTPEEREEYHNGGRSIHGGDAG
jgi:hypothetical protein